MSQAGSKLPAAMKAWQWSHCSDTLENSIVLNNSVPLPTEKRSLAPGESLVQVHVAALNPVDYKIAELPIVGRMAIPKPATPGLDFSGRVVEVGSDCNVKVGQMVFGKLEPKQQFGTLGEYIIGSKAGTAPIPDGVSVEDAATIGVCGLVTYQCLAPNVKAGDHIFVNGGSGGTGTFAVQIAKALGKEKNVQQCRDLGADEAIDYRKADVVTTLSEKSGKYDFVLDNVGTNYDLYWKSPQFTKPGAKYVQVGAAPSLSFMYDLAFRFLMPGVLGGGKRPFAFGMAATNFEHFTEIGKLLEDGKVRPVIDEVFAFENVPEAYRKLKTGHVKGKLVVKVSNVDDK
ncbi:hypothetical protein SNOG_09936 [Parastagonospora nodorum SN15]|uniref:Enoyl reductase (ER) domain-containing protein n=1 Tax=Phaeosphaeria nodorum (strain SN15 / ATCC MYA-4574 / FGSC 10173) TaxID=321614 RepID=Q0UE78_PHANO|nr:hypothetical protein SNOG_09936 [Parastagonospora nodorum SN15]EAT82271.2 hypothetical protein SNOG_09936 [Parastagonospora nodorum SN15]